MNETLKLILTHPVATVVILTVGCGGIAEIIRACRRPRSK
jgi:hypothetical protein